MKPQCEVHEDLALAHRRPRPGSVRHRARAAGQHRGRHDRDGQAPQGQAPPRAHGARARRHHGCRHPLVLARSTATPNRVDWQLGFGGDALEKKLTGFGDGWRFDGNEYNINALGHPGFGTLTHFLARTNGYSVAESFLIGTLASGGWELFVEWAEYGSLNDLVTTSPAGIPIGETAYQFFKHYRLGTYAAERGRRQRERRDDGRGVGPR